MMLQWLRSLRQQQPVTVVELRRRLAVLRQQQGQMTAARDALALDAMQSDEVAERYQQLDGEAAELARQIQMLEAALPRAERQETEAARQTEAAALARRVEDFFRLTHEARRFIAPILAQQVTGEALTQARKLSQLLAREANALHRLTGDDQFRRPLDPYAQIRDALVHRIERIERARWAKSAPITLLDDTRAAS